MYRRGTDLATEASSVLLVTQKRDPSRAPPACMFISTVGSDEACLPGT
jgi:hypothetical protein